MQAEDSASCSVFFFAIVTGHTGLKYFNSVKKSKRNRTTDRSTSTSTSTSQSIRIVGSVGKNPWSLEKTRGIPCGIPITGSRGRSRGIKREQFIVRKNERNRGGSHEARRNYIRIKGKKENCLITYKFPIHASQ